MLYAWLVEQTMSSLAHGMTPLGEDEPVNPAGAEIGIFRAN